LGFWIDPVSGDDLNGLAILLTMIWIASAALALCCPP